MILLIISIAAAVLWLFGPFVSSITCLDSLKQLLKNPDLIFKYFSLNAIELISVVALIAIIFALVFALKKNISAVKKAATFGLIGIAVVFVLAAFLFANTTGISVGQVFSAYFKGLNWGFWAMLVSFAAMIGVSSAANKD